MTTTRTQELKERIAEERHQQQQREGDEGDAAPTLSQAHHQAAPLSTPPQQPLLQKSPSTDPLLGRAFPLASRGAGSVIGGGGGGLLATLDELPDDVDPLSVPAKLDSNSAKQRAGPGGSSFATVLRLNEWEEVMREGGAAAAAAASARRA